MINSKFWNGAALYTVMLLVNAFAAILMAGYNATLRSFSFTRGWNNFLTLFGGLGGLLLAVGVTAVVVVFGTWLVVDNDKTDGEKLAAGAALAALLVVAVLFGKNIVSGFAEGKAWVTLIFFAIVGVETIITAWVARRPRRP